MAPKSNKWAKPKYRRSAKQTGGGHAECSAKRRLLKQRIQTLTAKVSVIESFLSDAREDPRLVPGRSEEE